MDYLCVGSNGYAQVGQQNFHMKNKAEMAVLLNFLETNFPIPEEFSGMCCYRVKWFNHDFGSYSEIVLMYNDQLLDKWENTDAEKFDRFWDWFYRVESVNLESDALNEEIESRYLKMTYGSDLMPVNNENKTR